MGSNKVFATLQYGQRDDGSFFMTVQLATHGCVWTSGELRLNATDKESAEQEAYAKCELFLEQLAGKE